MAGIQSIDKTTLVSLQVFKDGLLVDELPLFRENWEEYGGRHERTGLGEAVWRSEDPFSFHRLVTHDGADKEAAELMMQAHVVVFFLRLMAMVMIMEYFQLLPSQQNVRLSRMILFEGGLSILLRYIAMILKRVFRN